MVDAVAEETPSCEINLLSTKGIIYETDLHVA
jgi:hypothetical protein